VGRPAHDDPEVRVQLDASEGRLEQHCHRSGRSRRRVGRLNNKTAAACWFSARPVRGEPSAEGLIDVIDLTVFPFIAGAASSSSDKAGCQNDARSVKTFSKIVS